MAQSKIVAIVGMSGSGKSEVSAVFEAAGFKRIRFGDITDEEIKKRGLKPSEAGERTIREALRREHGMAAYAILSLPRIEAAARNGNVVIDGLYSWEEYLVLKDRFGDRLVLVAVWSSPRARYERLAQRPVRRLTSEEASSRDRAEIENSHKGGPIAMADHTIVNDSTVGELRKRAQEVVAWIR